MVFFLSNLLIINPFKVKNPRFRTRTLHRLFLRVLCPSRPRMNLRMLIAIHLLEYVFIPCSRSLQNSHILPPVSSPNYWWSSNKIATQSSLSCSACLDRAVFYLPRTSQSERCHTCFGYLRRGMQRVYEPLDEWYMASYRGWSYRFKPLSEESYLLDCGFPLWMVWRFLRQQARRTCTSELTIFIIAVSCSYILLEHYEPY